MPNLTSLKESVKKHLPFIPSGYRTLRRAAVRSLFGLAGLFGLNIARKQDYYSPLPDIFRLRENYPRFTRPSSMAGIPYDLEEFKQTFLAMQQNFGAEFSGLPSVPELIRAGYGLGFHEVDALVLYLMIRTHKPRRLIEVGSGVSTYYAAAAGRVNRTEGHPLEITCIEPHPYEKLKSLPEVAVHAVEVQSCDPDLFRRLEAGDLLFIDSTHIVKIDGDVPFLYLEILPALSKRVFIHIHDMPFPYNIPYPPNLWLFDVDWPVFWNEAMLVQAFLCYNDEFRIILSLPLLRFFDESFLKERLEHYETVEQNPVTFSSLWLQKVQ
jgi:hypothetical protein